MNQIKIGNKMVGNGQRTFIIAEIGINHNGDINIAKKIIKSASDAGCDAVKFQKRTIEVVYTTEELATPRENPFGTTNGDLKRGLEFSKEQYTEIDKYCKELDILWLVSPWDEGAADFMDDFDVPCHKIASASLTDDNLLRHIRAKGLPIIISEGMSTEAEVDHAIEVLGKENLIILHTVSTYPAKIENLHLNVIKTLKERYKNVPIGYSGHEAGILPSVISVALGACVVERHLTLDRGMWGSDHKASIEPHEMKKMVEEIRIVEKALGNEEIVCLDEEIPVKNKLRRK